MENASDPNAHLLTGECALSCKSPHQNRLQIYLRVANLAIVPENCAVDFVEAGHDL